MRRRSRNPYISHRTPYAERRAFWDANRLPGATKRGDATFDWRDWHANMKVWGPGGGSRGLGKDLKVTFVPSRTGRRDGYLVLTSTKPSTWWKKAIVRLPLDVADRWAAAYLRRKVKVRGATRPARKLRSEDWDELVRRPPTWARASATATPSGWIRARMSGLALPRRKRNPLLRPKARGERSSDVVPRLPGWAPAGAQMAREFTPGRGSTGDWTLISKEGRVLARALPWPRHDVWVENPRARKKKKRNPYIAGRQPYSARKAFWDMNRLPISTKGRDAHFGWQDWTANLKSARGMGRKIKITFVAGRPGFAPGRVAQSQKEGVLVLTSRDPTTWWKKAAGFTSEAAARDWVRFNLRRKMPVRPMKAYRGTARGMDILLGNPRTRRRNGYVLYPSRSKKRTATWRGSPARLSTGYSGKFGEQFLGRAKVIGPYWDDEAGWLTRAIRRKRVKSVEFVPSTPGRRGSRDASKMGHLVVRFADGTKFVDHFMRHWHAEDRYFRAYYKARGPKYRMKTSPRVRPFKRGTVAAFEQLLGNPKRKRRRPPARRRR